MRRAKAIILFRGAVALAPPPRQAQMRMPFIRAFRKVHSRTYKRKAKPKARAPRGWATAHKFRDANKCRNGTDGHSRDFRRHRIGGKTMACEAPRTIHDQTPTLSPGTSVGPATAKRRGMTHGLNPAGLADLLHRLGQRSRSRTACSTSPTV